MIFRSRTVPPSLNILIIDLGKSFFPYNKKEEKSFLAAAGEERGGEFFFPQREEKEEEDFSWGKEKGIGSFIY